MKSFNIQMETRTCVGCGARFRVNSTSGQFHHSTYCQEFNAFGPKFDPQSREIKDENVIVNAPIVKPKERWR